MPAKSPSAEVLAIWEAEDGHCQGCHRPMDRSLARTGRDKRGERRLVCPDCKERRPDLLAAAIAAGDYGMLEQLRRQIRLPRDEDDADGQPQP